MEETVKCSACGGIMREYKRFVEPEIESDIKRDGYSFEYERELVVRNKAILFECKGCHSILKVSFLQREIFLKTKDKPNLVFKKEQQ